MKQEPTDLSMIKAVSEIEPDAAYWTVDKDQNITFWSEGATRLLGFEPQEVLGKHCSIAIQCVQCAKGCGLKQYGLIKNMELAHFQKDGQQITAVKWARAIYDEGGEFKGGVEILRPQHIEPPNQPSSELTEFHGILTADPDFLSLLTSLRHVAHTEVNVLIRGETGTGKEMVARAVHNMSPRSSRPFVAVNCGTLSREFLASEIFGHRKGAFTGAIADKQGLLAQAKGGTLFLDEVAELPPDVQTMLLRVIQERRYKPLGDVRDYKADIRIISATHTSLRQAVATGRFREDLMYRLRVVPIFLPNLKDRQGDVTLLMKHALATSAEKMKSPQVVLSNQTLNHLNAYSWPGNIRELFNLAEYLTVTRGGKRVDPQHLLPEFQEVKVEPTMVKSDRRAAVEHALAQANGSMEEAAKLLGVSRITLWRWRKKLAEEG